MMEQLIRTSESSIVYGRFKGEDNQELFRCSRSLENTDLHRYINEHRALVAQMENKIPFVNDNEIEDLRNVDGKEMIAYWRMYFRCGWAGRWMFESNDKVTTLECHGIDEIVDWICKNFEKGCTFYMDGYMREHFKNWGSENRYLIKPFMSEYYKVMIDTTYGNGDYPVRIYLYRDKED